MPRHKQSEEQIAVMRNRILDATVSLLDELQPEEISIRKIADKADISHMAIYTYYKDRNELVQALISRQEEQIQNRFNKILGKGKDNNFVGNLRDALKDYIEIAKTRPKLFRLIWVLPMIIPHKRIQKKLVFETQINVVSELLIKGQEKGLFIKRDAQVSALTILSMINAPLFLFHLGRMSDPKICDRVINETLDIIINYITGKSN